MTDSKSAWDDVADRFAGLGLKLKMHLEQNLGDDAGDLQDALRNLGTTIEQAVSAIGNAARDDAVKEDAKAAARSMAEAITSTFNEAGEALQKVFAKKGGTDTGASGPDA
ncbi:MAG TPA: hypothetical protein VHN98_08185 [Acidimicrobiales bacterium]|nr:hypothetical protein [Acidimicrobiales bacterium]